MAVVNSKSFSNNNLPFTVVNNPFQYSWNYTPYDSFIAHDLSNHFVLVNLYVIK